MLDFVDFTCGYCGFPTNAPRHSARWTTGTCTYCFSRAHDLWDSTRLEDYLDDWRNFHEYVDGLVS